MIRSVQRSRMPAVVNSRLQVYALLGLRHSRQFSIVAIEKRVFSILSSTSVFETRPIRIFFRYTFQDSR